MDEQLREILADVGGLAMPAAELAVDQDLYAAGLTSFATVSVMLAIEEAFAVEFPDRLLKRETFSSIVALRRVIATLRDDHLAA
jgi:acyl carrier protein